MTPRGWCKVQRIPSALTERIVWGDGLIYEHYLDCKLEVARCSFSDTSYGVCEIATPLAVADGRPKIVALKDTVFSSVQRQSTHERRNTGDSWNHLLAHYNSEGEGGVRRRCGECFAVPQSVVYLTNSPLCSFQHN